MQHYAHFRHPDGTFPLKDGGDAALRDFSELLRQLALAPSIRAKAVLYPKIKAHLVPPAQGACAVRPQATEEEKRRFFRKALFIISEVTIEISVDSEAAKVQANLPTAPQSSANLRLGDKDYVLCFYSTNTTNPFHELPGTLTTTTGTTSGTAPGPSADPPLPQYVHFRDGSFRLAEGTDLPSFAALVESIIGASTIRAKAALFAKLKGHLAPSRSEVENGYYELAFHLVASIKRESITAGHDSDRPLVFTSTPENPFRPQESETHPTSSAPTVVENPEAEGAVDVMPQLQKLRSSHLGAVESFLHTLQEITVEDSTLLGIVIGILQSRALYHYFYGHSFQYWISAVFQSPPHEMEALRLGPKFDLDTREDMKALLCKFFGTGLSDMVEHWPSAFPRGGYHEERRTWLETGPIIIRESQGRVHLFLRSMPSKSKFVSTAAYLFNSRSINVETGYDHGVTDDNVRVGSTPVTNQDKSLTHVHFCHPYASFELAGRRAEFTLLLERFILSLSLREKAHLFREIKRCIVPSSVKNVDLLPYLLTISTTVIPTMTKVGFIQVNDLLATKLEIGTDSYVLCLYSSSPENPFPPSVVQYTTEILNTKEVSESIIEACMSIPKAELHLHIERTLDLDMAIRVAARNGLTIPKSTDLKERSSLLLTEQDFFELTSAYLERARTQGVVHVEMCVDALSHLRRGVPLDTLFGGIKRALASSEEYLSWFLFVSFGLDSSAEEAMALLDQPEIRKGTVGGISVVFRDHSRISGFSVVATRARELGLRFVLDMGETTGSHLTLSEFEVPVLDPERIASCLPGMSVFCNPFPPKAVRYTICPLVSGADERYIRNERFLFLAHHATINSGYYGGHIGDCYVAVAKALGVRSIHAIYCLARESIAASFASAEQRKRHEELLRAWGEDQSW